MLEARRLPDGSLIPPENTATRRSVTLVLAGGAAGLLTLWTYLVFAKVPHDRLVFLLGAFASGICILLFASPLSTVREVVATSNAASIYGPLTATQCTNCAMWTVYGIGIGDILLALAVLAGCNILRHISSSFPLFLFGQRDQISTRRQQRRDTRQRIVVDGLRRRVDEEGQQQHRFAAGVIVSPARFLR